jgi:lysophospholipase L1-like esterase
MKITLILFALVLLFTGFAPRKKKILIIGDSISIGYTPFVEQALADVAEVVHNKGNAEHTGTGLKNISEWLGNEDWDIIQFNWGLWDLAYRHPDSKFQGNRDKVKGSITHTPEQYRINLDSLVQILKKTDAKLIFVTTSYVPENEAGRFMKDPEIYNKIAKEVMKKNGIAVNDIFAKTKSTHKKYGKGSDDVHYTPEGYKKIATFIVRMLRKEIG